MPFSVLIQPPPRYEFKANPNPSQNINLPLVDYDDSEDESVYEDAPVYQSQNEIQDDYNSEDDDELCPTFRNEYNGDCDCLYTLDRDKSFVNFINEDVISNRFVLHWHDTYIFEVRNSDGDVIFSNVSGQMMMQGSKARHIIKAIKIFFENRHQLPINN